MKGDEMTERDKQIAEYVAQTVMTRILSAVQSEEVADKVIDTWGAKIDRTIGRALRRLGFYVIVAVLGIASIKFGLTERLVSLLSSGKP